MGSNWSKIALKILWVLGLIGCTLISYHFEQTVKQKGEATFDFLPLYWFKSVVPILFGVYISLLFVKWRSMTINTPLLLCVSIPCLIIALYNPVIYSIVANTTSSSSSFSVPIPFWMIKINSLGIPSIVAGATFFPSFFGNSPSKNPK